jgi:hypothetical protein
MEFFISRIGWIHCHPEIRAALLQTVLHLQRLTQRLISDNSDKAFAEAPVDDFNEQLAVHNGIICDIFGQKARSTTCKVPTTTCARPSSSNWEPRPRRNACQLNGHNDEVVVVVAMGDNAAVVVGNALPGSVAQDDSAAELACMVSFISLFVLQRLALI